MPKITIQESSVDIRPQAAPDVNAQNFTGGWKSATESMKVLDDTVQQFKKVRDYNEVSKAELSLRQDLGAIEQAAANEQDPTKIEEYRKKIDETIGKHASTISDPMIQQEARDKFNLTGYSAYSGIANDFRKKSINIGQGNFLTATDQYERDYTNSNNDVDRQRIKAAWFDSLTKAQQAGLFAADDVAKMKIAQTKKFDERDLMYDVQNLPDQVLNRRKAGAYASLSDKEVSEGINAANNMRERILKEQKAATKQAQLKNEIEVISGAANGMIYGLDEVNAMVGNGEIRPEVGKAYVRYLTSPASVNPAFDDTGYAKMVEGVFKAGNQDAIVKVITDTLDGGADGKMRHEDVQNLVALANMRAKELYPTENVGLKTGSKQVDVDGLYKYVTDWAKNAQFDKKQTAQLTSEWVNALVTAQDVTPKEVTDAVIKRSIVAAHPEVAALDDVPNMVIGKDSPLRLVFPKTTNVYPRRIYNPKTGKLEANPEVNQGTK